MKVAVKVADNVATRIVKKTEQRYTLGVVYEPDVVDAHGEYATAEDIEAACWAFNAEMQASPNAEIVKVCDEIREALTKSANGEEAVVYFDEALIEKGALGVQHAIFDEALGQIVESYILPVDCEIGGEAVKKGAWMMGVIWHELVWKQIQEGNITGYSMGGTAFRESEE